MTSEQQANDKMMYQLGYRDAVAGVLAETNNKIKLPEQAKWYEISFLVPIWIKPKTKQFFIQKVAQRTIEKGSKLTHDQTLLELLK